MKLNFIKRKKGFTLIELVVVITIMAILGLIIVPNLTAYTQKGELSKHTNNVRLIENSVNLHVMDYGDFPRLTDDAYTKAEIEAYSQGISDSTGKKVVLDPDGNYYDIDYEKLKEYVSIPAPVDRPKYILQNPVGKVFYLHEITVNGDKRADFSIEGEESGEVTVPPVKPEPTGIYTKEEIEALKVQGYIEVKTAEELNSVRNNLSGKYIQTQDIDLSTITNFEPIGNNSTKFTGIYDGGGVKITGLTINKPTTDYIGLFGYTSGSTIKNVGLLDVNIKGQSRVGGLVGYADNLTIENSYSTGSVTGQHQAGGLVGRADNNSTITRSYATGPVIGTRQNGYGVGGLVGYVGNSTIRNSYATGSVTSTGNYVGGLVGYVSGGAITNSYATGSVTGNQYVGGLVGWASSSTITNSYATGSVTGSGAYVGGLVGYVSGGAITNSYATGEVRGNRQVGGLVGWASSSTITNSYWDKDTTGQTTSAGGIGKTTNEMKKQTTYSGWDFDTVWEIQEGVSYPTLINNPERH